MNDTQEMRKGLYGFHGKLAMTPSVTEKISVSIDNRQ